MIDVDTSITLNAFGKINLTLDVLDRRPDGYHNIESVMQTISLADRVSLTLSNDGKITLEIDGPQCAGVPSDHTNLAWRAAYTYLEFIGRLDLGVNIRLTKNLPSQAGLGGGSSDAATVLTGMDRLTCAHIDCGVMQSLALSLGADVPFFLVGGSAKVSGVGEIIEPIPPVDLQPFVIVMPKARISTKEAYDALDSTQNRTSANATRNWPRAGFSNDFQQTVFELSPVIEETAKIISTAGAKTVLLCGSGAALVGFSSDANGLFDLLKTQDIGQVWKTGRLLS